LKFFDVTGVVERVSLRVRGGGLGEPGGVNKVQVDVVHLQLLQRGINGALDVADVGDDLGGHEELFSGDARFLDGQTDLLLGVVQFGTIDMAEAAADSLLDGVDGGAVNSVKVGALEEGGTSAVAKLANVCQSWGHCI
jgi:hypothetical protein